MQNIHLNSITQPCFGGFITNAWVFVLLLTTLIFLLPLAIQADGLFDFQMKLAQKGNAEAQYKVGEMYETGFGVEQDMKQAKSWITKSAGQGHETAGFKLLYWDVEKNGFTVENKSKVDELNNKATAGNSQAQYYVGKMHANGVGVEKDPDTAIDWLNKAALVGVLEAERELSFVREDKQRDALSKQRITEEKKQAELKAKQQKKQQELQQQQQRKLQAQKKAESKALADKAAKEKLAADKAAAVAAAEDKKARLYARNEAEKKQRIAAKQQALLKKKQVQKKQRKQQFESDPCSGKSAKFLSTCR